MFRNQLLMTPRALRVLFRIHGSLNNGLKQVVGIGSH